MRFSYSTISIYNKCKWLWHATNVAGISAAPRPDRLELGTLIHAGLEAAIKGNDYATAILDKVDSIYPTSIAMDGEVHFPTPEDRTEALLEASTAQNIVRRAVEYIDLSKWETVYLMGLPLVEQSFEVEQGNGRVFVWKADWVAREKDTGAVWLFDHKTRAAMQPDDAEEYNFQMALYQCFLRKAGIDTVGTITFQIRSALPSTPKLNMDGSLSRADIACDWETYRAALLFHGLNPDDYEGMRTKLEGKEFFRFTRQYRPPEYLERLWSEVVEPTMEDIERFIYTIDMVAANGGGTVRIPRNINAVNCKLCSLRELCHNELRGYDTEHMFETGQFVRGVGRNAASQGSTTRTASESEHQA